MNQGQHECPGDSGCTEPFVCPLNRVIVGTAVRIKRLSAPADVSRRLRELGLGEDQEVTLLQNTGHLVCLVCNARLAISAQLGENIFVEPLPGAPRKS